MSSAFPPGAGPFFRDLARHNTREWFQTHRDDYERLVRGPLEDLYADAVERYGPGRILRPNRDVRFSADKSPYALSASLVAGEVGGVYLRIDADGLSAGGGVYEPSRDQLQRAREAIADRPRAAADLRAALRRLEGAGYEVAGPSLKTAPRGWPKDHPEIELLRLQHYAALRMLPLDAARGDVLRSWRAVEPLSAWAREHVGPARSWS